MNCIMLSGHFILHNYIKKHFHSNKFLLYSKCIQMNKSYIYIYIYIFQNVKANILYFCAKCIMLKNKA